MSTLYKKEGKRYIPVAEYGDEWATSHQHGIHLVVSMPYIKQTIRISDKWFDPVQVSTLYTCADRIASALREIDTLAPSHHMTDKQKSAWDAFLKTMPKDFCTHGCLQKKHLNEVIRTSLDSILKVER